MSLSDRILADSRDAELWKAARVGKIGASDAGRYAKEEPASIDSYTRAKLMPSWEGNQYSEHGHEREPIILADHSYPQNTHMYTSLHNLRFVATPDGIFRGRLAQVKTTIKDFRSKRTGEILVPPHYRRQMWWEQMVMGPEFIQTDFIYEQYKIINGVLVPEFNSTVVVIDRDDAEIAKLERIALAVLRRLDLANF